MLINSSIGYFRDKVQSRLQLLNERAYVERVWSTYDSLTINATNIKTTTSTDGFIINIETHLNQNIFDNPLVVKINCSNADHNMTLEFTDRNKTVNLIQKPYLFLQECEVLTFSSTSIKSISESSQSIRLKTARGEYTHSILNFSKIISK